VHLEVHPELRRGTEGSGEQPRHVRRNAALSPRDLTDALDGDAELFGQIGLGQPERAEELFGENLTRVWRQVVVQHECELYILSGYVEAARQPGDGGFLIADA